MFVLPPTAVTYSPPKWRRGYMDVSGRFIVVRRNSPRAWVLYDLGQPGGNTPVGYRVGTYKTRTAAFEAGGLIGASQPANYGPYNNTYPEYPGAPFGPFGPP